ncbi:hypothetical protein OE88DRAFT_44428 [Heliocybe sulcata]|uniref:Pentacotripeptide-repeat region of PRORP domain-containing protein n=1 Tax=Heliocybe sulcata TaxID=5364 RepID=A0A5C3NIK6_9AGAM|nr:hypothetical protein OE88DRAFT_44428 [Heliocybe sulcata]
MTLLRVLSNSNEFLASISALQRARRLANSASVRRAAALPRSSGTRFQRYTTSSYELSSLVAAYKASVRRKKGVAGPYQNLTRALRKKDQCDADNGPETLSEELLLQGIRVLLRSGGAKNVELSKTVLSDMPVLFGIPLRLEVYEDVVLTLLKYGHTIAALEWLRNMVQEPHAFVPTDRLWSKLLGQLAANRMSSLIPETIQLIRRGRAFSGCDDSLPAEVASLILRALAENVPDLEALAHILDELKKDDLPQQASELLFVKHIFERADLRSHAALLHEHYLHLRLEQQNQKLSEELLSNGRGGAIRLYRTLSEKGFQAQPSTLNVILGDSSDVMALRELEREMNITATSPTWSFLLQNALHDGDVVRAKSIYTEAHTSGISLVRETAEALVQALCRGIKPLQVPDDSTIDLALRIFEESIRSKSDGQAEAGIFVILLRTLLLSPNKTKYLALAISMIEHTDVSMNGSTLHTIIIMLLRVATTFDRAIALYEFVKKRWPDVTPRAEGYSRILRTYCRTRGAQTSPLQPDQYFQIVRDMRHAKHPVTDDVYSLALSQIRAVNGVRGREDALFAVRRIGCYLMVEPSFTPGIGLWNQLMETYVAVGSVTEARRVWERLLLSGRYDNKSLRIIVRAFKMAGNTVLPSQIYAKVHKAGFMLDITNWNNWLESVCSANMFEEATRLLCLEMPSPPDINAPDVRSARIVLTCAKKNGQYSKSLSIIRKHLPELWERLPETLKNPELT